RPVGEPHLVADRAPELDAQLLRETLGDGPRGDPAWLGVPDDAVEPTTELEADLRDLRRLARPRLAGDDDDLVVADRGGDVVAAVDDGQVLGVPDLGHARGPRGTAGLT